MSPDFPAIRHSTLPDGVDRVRYSLDRNAIAPFLVATEYLKEDSMTLADFRLNLLNQARVRSAAEGTFTQEAFLSEVADRLADAGEIEQLTVVWFEGEGKRRRKLAVHGFDLDDSDNSVALAVLRWGGGSELGQLQFHRG